MKKLALLMRIQAIALVLLLISCGGNSSGEMDGLKIVDLSFASGGDEVRVGFGMTARGCSYEIAGPSSAVVSGYVLISEADICPSGESWHFEWDKFVLTTPDGSTLTVNPGETKRVAAGELHTVAAIFELAAPASGRYTISYDGTRLLSADL